MPPGQPGSGDEGCPAAFQLLGEGRTAALRLGLVAIGPFPAEADDAEGRWRHQRELGLAANQVLGVPGQVEVALDAGAESPEAEGLHGYPYLQRPEPAGQLKAPVGEVDLAFVTGGVAVEVVGMDGERSFQSDTVADQHAAAFHGLEQPFVGIEGDRVGPLDAGQHRPPLGGQRGEAAIGGVDVQPQPVGRADVGKIGEGIDGAGVGRSGAGAQREGNASCGAGQPGRPRLRCPATGASGRRSAAPAPGASAIPWRARSGPERSAPGPTNRPRSQETDRRLPRAPRGARSGWRPSRRSPGRQRRCLAARARCGTSR